MFVGTLDPATIRIKGLNIVGGFLVFESTIYNLWVDLILEDLIIRSSINNVESLISNFLEAITLTGDIDIFTTE